MFKGFKEPWVFRSHGHSVQSQRISGFGDLDFKDCGLREFRAFSCLGMFGGLRSGLSVASPQASILLSPTALRNSGEASSFKFTNPNPKP